MQPEAVEVTPATLAEKAAPRRLLELYQHDLSEFTGEGVDEFGLFGYRCLDHCWTEPNRQPFLIRAAGRIAGFALVSDLAVLPENAGAMAISEFFVPRACRRRGVGARAAQSLCARFPGRWEVREIAANLPAQAFWRGVIGAYTGGADREVMLDNDDWRGPVQSFTSRAAVHDAQRSSPPAGSAAAWPAGLHPEHPRTTLRTVIAQLVAVEPEVADGVAEEILQRHIVTEQAIPSRRIVHSSIPLLLRHGINSSQNSGMHAIILTADTLACVDFGAGTSAKRIRPIEHPGRAVQDSSKALRVPFREPSHNP